MSRDGVLAGGGGSPKPPSEMSGGDGTLLPGPICKQVISCTQERWIIQTCGEPEAIELLCQEITFQDGRVRNDQGSTVERRLDMYLGLKGCIPVSSNCLGTPHGLFAEAGTTSNHLPG